MKKILLALSLLCAVPAANAQSLPDLSGIKLSSEADFNEKADDAALKVAKFLLSVDLNKENRDHQMAYSYLDAWMNGTPKYMFNTPAVEKITDGNAELAITTLAAMTEYVLEHKEQKDDPNKTTFNALKRTIALTKDPKRKFETGGEFKNAMDAESKGTLEEYVAKMSGH